MVLAVCMYVLYLPRGGMMLPLALIAIGTWPLLCLHEVKYEVPTISSLIRRSTLPAETGNHGSAAFYTLHSDLARSG